MVRMDARLETLVAQARGDARVLAVLLFGSAARGEDAHSDLDVCLVLGPERGGDAERVRLDYLTRFDLDVQVFQALPVYIRARVLRDGRVFLCKDEDALYDIALATVRAFEDFKPTYERYLEAVADGRP